MSESVDLWALFVSAFISSTLLPGGSEMVLVGLALQGGRDPAVLVAMATFGNALGGMSSWLIGRVLPAWKAEHAALMKAVERVRRWGSPVLLLSWLPVVGDPLCLAAGWLRIHWLSALVFITVGKAARYAVLAWAV